MRVTAVRPFLFSPAHRTYLVVRVETDEGLTGLGTFGPSHHEEAGLGALAQLAPQLRGADPFDTEAIWQRLFRCNFYPADLVGMGVISAIDMALWDIKARSLNQPLWRLLGGKVRDHVPLYTWLGHVATVDEAVSVAMEKVRAGWRCLRLGIPDRDGVIDPPVAVRDAVERVAAVRDAVGPAVEICLDAHTRLDLPDAVTLARELEPYNLRFLEDPLRSENLENYRRLRRQTAIPLAAGEQFATKWRFRSVIEEDLIDYARIDLGNVGGITEALKVAGMAQTHSIKIAPHNPLDPLLGAACLHFSVATENTTLLEAGNCTDDFLRDVYPTRPAFPVANWPVPDGPGLGVDLNEAAIGDYPFVRRAPHQFRRPDGSYSNW